MQVSWHFSACWGAFFAPQSGPSSNCRCLSQSALSQGPLLLAYARIALAKSRSKWAAWLSSQRLPSVISTERFLPAISRERSESRNLFPELGGRCGIGEEFFRDRFNLNYSY